jgi:hypothetical protein
MDISFVVVIEKSVRSIKFLMCSGNPSALLKKILRLLVNTTLRYDILSRAITGAQKAATMQPTQPSGTAAPPNSPASIPGENTQLAKPSTPIAGDILYGADEIAEFLFGSRKHRRRVYNLVDGNGLPIFRIGVNICARKSILLEWIANQEKVSTGS